MEQVLCRHFSGYKPCGFSKSCDSNCPHLEIPETRILIVHLEALGAVLRATSLLSGLKRKFPSSHITWVTKSLAKDLLNNNPYIDRVFSDSALDLQAVRQLKFDVSFCVDKSLQATGIISGLDIHTRYGFESNSVGAILPANESAKELWNLGLSNELKFFKNQKTEVQLMYEAFELKYQGDEYQLLLNKEEKDLTQERRRVWTKNKNVPVIGINTGCSTVIPYKKLSIECHIELIEYLKESFDYPIVLLGGKEDEKRNETIAKATCVYSSPTDLGLRDGLCSVEACDFVISGDSLGMHMAIALKKYVVAWFGPTCSQEIELYGRGKKLHSKAKCGPCWKRSCHKDPMCYELLDLKEVVEAIRERSPVKESVKIPATHL